MHHLICILSLIILLFSDVLIIFNKTLDLKKNTHIAARWYLPGRRQRKEVNATHTQNSDVAIYAQY